MRVLKAQLRLRERRATPYDGQGMREPPVVPVELRPLPVASATGKAGRGIGKPLKGEVAHWFLFIISLYVSSILLAIL
ncbi:MAG: hypothetical protein RXO22_03535 [Thermocladium sp.]